MKLLFSLIVLFFSFIAIEQLYAIKLSKEMHDAIYFDCMRLTENSVVKCSQVLKNIEKRDSYFRYDPIFAAHGSHPGTNTMRWTKKNEKETINAMIKLLPNIKNTNIEKSQCEINCPTPTSCATDSQENCSNSKRALAAFKFSKLMYGINSQKLDNGEYQYLYSEGIPAQFKITKTYATSSSEYNQDVKRLNECNQRGFRAIRAEGADDSIIFAIRGTVPSSLGTVKSDLNLGLSHLRCAHQLVKDVIEVAKSGKKIILTGHSLGGGLAEAIGLLAISKLDGIIKDNINVITFNGFGGKETAQRFQELEKIKENTPIVNLPTFPRRNAINYYLENDPISPIGTHLGESRIIKNPLSSPNKSKTKSKSSLHAHGTYSIDCYLLGSEEKFKDCHRPSFAEVEAKKLIAQPQFFYEPCDPDSESKINTFYNLQVNSNPSNFLGMGLTSLSGLVHEVGKIKEHILQRYRRAIDVPPLH